MQYNNVDKISGSTFIFLINDFKILEEVHPLPITDMQITDMKILDHLLLTNNSCKESY